MSSDVGEGTARKKRWRVSIGRQ